MSQGAGVDEHRGEALTAVSLFSGVGGLDCGLERAGFRHLLMCEQDAWRRGVLAARFPGVPIADDVRGVARNGDARANERGARRERGRLGTRDAVDLVAGGSPCQDLSVAGQRRGLAGSRSNLFFEYARVVDALRPRWFLFENVCGLFSSNGGRDFGTVLGTLADIGYGLGWRVLDSRYFGVPQRRRRVFIVGALVDDDPRAAAERAGEVLAVGSRCERHPATRGEAGPDVAGTLGGGAGERGWSQDVERMTFVPTLVAGALVKRYGKGTDSDATDTMVVAAPLTAGGHPNSNMPGRRKEDDENLVAYSLRSQERNSSQGRANYVTAFHQTQDPIHGDDFTPALGETSIGMGVGIGASVRRLTPRECEALQALPADWTNPDGKAPDSRRYAGLGDAVTASVGQWLGERIIASQRRSAEALPTRKGTGSSDDG